VRGHLVAACLLTGLGTQVQAQPAAPEYDVVAVRVEFKPDTTRFTTGDGTFSGLSWPVESRVDPLPHDAAYFEAHLAFLRDYVAAASGGRTQVRTHLIDTVIRVSQEMGAYSPHGMEADSAPERRRLARLVAEAWQLADRQAAMDVDGLDPAQTAFVIFHAGIGRDVELTGTALTKTPLDLPSLYFSEEALAALGVSGISFKGLPVTQTAMIPRSETRAGVNAITEAPILLELSINGLLAASFFNYLGVPDLFNTQTGESGIGPFGLMDPLGFFAFRGLFPPMPTAWTRLALGWVEPRELVAGEEFSLSAGEVARASVTESEYFLVENRVREPLDQGVTLEVWNHSGSSSVRFEGLSDTFNRFNVEDFPGGVVMGVSHYDWALPGWDADGSQYNGGMLIWHVDERQLQQGVNDDPDRRAVDLEEADGAQDIGFDPNGGSPFDYFFAGNPTRVVLPSGQEIVLYDNRFAHDTTPSSAANDGGGSYVTLDAFSEPGATMSARFDYGSAIGLEAENDLGVVVWPGGAVQAAGASVYTGRSVVFADPALEPVSARSRPTHSGNQIAVLDTAQGGYQYRVYRQMPGRLEPVQSLSLPGFMPTKGPIVGAGDANYVLRTDGNTSEVVRLTRQAESIVLGDGGLGLVGTPSGIYFLGRRGTGPLNAAAEWTYSLDADTQVGLPVMGRDHAGIWGAVPVAERVLVLRSDRTTQWIDSGLHTGTPGAVEYVVLADVDNDQALDIIATAGQTLLAWSQSGALLPPFPLRLDAPAAAEPLIGRTDAGVVVVVAARNGTVYGFDLARGGRQREGFPLAVGRTLTAAPLLEDSRLHVVTRSGRLRSYRVPGLEQVDWGQYRGSARNAGWAEIDLPPEPGQRLLVAEETYNWPNPMRDGRTFFRSMTTEAAEITITIIDAAGTRIDELAYAVLPHSPTEIVWETQAASGLYFARVRAIGSSGRSDSQLIRLAVIR